MPDIYTFIYQNYQAFQNALLTTDHIPSGPFKYRVGHALDIIFKTAMFFFILDEGRLEKKAIGLFKIQKKLKHLYHN